ncbi:hypothetical protein COB55_00375 [Candidatus Wolfebacteria bacterium]|nr:MAG: hypothetical protein COB55_00375 [Candidatus Wolfebacteria bacterium]
MNNTPGVTDGPPSKIADAASWIIVILVFLLPIFFVPVTYFSTQFSKVFFVIIAVILSVVLWLFSTLKSSKLSFSNTPLMMSGIGVVVATFLSAVLSKTVWLSMIGSGAEITTAIFTLILFLLFFLSTTLFNTKRRSFNIYSALFLSFFLTSLYHGLRLIFGGDFLSFGVLTSMTSTPIGAWYDLAVYFGLFTIFSIVALEILTLSKSFKFLLYLVLLISLFFLAVTNFTVAWTIIAGFTLLFFVYLITFNRQRTDIDGSNLPSTKKTSGISIVVFIISLVFILGEGSLGTVLSNTLNTSFVEVRPSWNATLEVAKSSLSENLIFGSGPNTFREQWLLHKSPEVNQTIFWNTDFVMGNGFFPTVFATTGLVGIIAWSVFLLLFIIAGIRGVLTKTSDTFSYYVRISSFIGALYLWIFAVRYNPSVVMISLTMILTGLFVASLAQDGLIKKYELTFSDKPKVGFFAISGLLGLLIVVIIIGYNVTQKYVSNVFFQKAVYSVNTLSDLVEGERLIKKAYATSKSDLYARSLAEIEINKLNVQLSESSLSTDEAIATFQTTLSNAIDSAKNAVSINDGNYENFLVLGRVYEAVLPLQVDGAYDNAIDAYSMAELAAPNNPSISLVQARLEVSNGDMTAARKHILRALEMKSNYTEAIFLQSQIEAEAGNIRAAIRAAEDAAAIAPNDRSIFFQLGILKYNNNDFVGAVKAFERAVKISSDYANAQYFLGLSLYETGKVDKAIEQFTNLSKTNSTNQQISDILKNLKEGREPIPATVDESTLPIDETITTTEG